MGDAEPEATVQNDLIWRLGEIIKQRGASNVAIELKVSQSALKSWQHGTVPSQSNRAKIEKFLADNTVLPTDAAGAEKSGELFAGDKQPEITT